MEKVGAVRLKNVGGRDCATVPWEKGEGEGEPYEGGAVVH